MVLIGLTGYFQDFWSIKSVGLMKETAILHIVFFSQYLIPVKKLSITFAEVKKLTWNS